MHHNPISITDLSYIYPDGTQALCSVNLEIRATERVAVVGANGSGKSTLLAHLNGLLLPQCGTVVVGEYPVKPQHLKAIRNFVGMVFQNPDDQLFMPTVWEDVTFGPMNQGLRNEPLHQRCFMAMQSMGLSSEDLADRPTGHLSGGQKKRVAIAGVLAMQPQVLALDEPSSQLDPRSRRQLIELLRQLPITQLIATHDLDLALELCERTVVLSEGCVVRDGPTASIFGDTHFLEAHGLEQPLSYSRPYCQLKHRPALHRSKEIKIYC
jgi:cobalt/nickel transport system ATP-binding protein